MTKINKKYFHLNNKHTVNPNWTILSLRIVAIALKSAKDKNNMFRTAITTVMRMD